MNRSDLPQRQRKLYELPQRIVIAYDTHTLLRVVLCVKKNIANNLTVSNHSGCKDRRKRSTGYIDKNWSGLS